MGEQRAMVRHEDALVAGTSTTVNGNQGALPHFDERQQAVLDLIRANPALTLVGVAPLAGVKPQTISVWRLRVPGFGRALDAARLLGRAELIGVAEGQVATLLEGAIAVLRGAIEGKPTTRMQLRAAEVALSYSLKKPAQQVEVDARSEEQRTWVVRFADE